MKLDSCHEFWTSGALARDRFTPPNADPVMSDTYHRWKFYQFTKLSEELFDLSSVAMGCGERAQKLSAARCCRDSPEEGASQWGQCHRAHGWLLLVSA